LMKEMILVESSDEQKRTELQRTLKFNKEQIAAIKHRAEEFQNSPYWISRLAKLKQSICRAIEVES
jgi:seryl-tRNA(Sec) selenium transferase